MGIKTWALTFFIWNKAIKTFSQIHLLNFFIRTVSEQHDGEYMTEMIFYVRYFSAYFCGLVLWGD